MPKKPSSGRRTLTKKIDQSDFDRLTASLEPESADEERVVPIVASVYGRGSRWVQYRVVIPKEFVLAAQITDMTHQAIFALKKTTERSIADGPPPVTVTMTIIKKGEGSGRKHD